jgi:hypothetical protein
MLLAIADRTLQNLNRGGWREPYNASMKVDGTAELPHWHGLKAVISQSDSLGKQNRHASLPYAEHRTNCLLGAQQNSPDMTARRSRKRVYLFTPNERINAKRFMPFSRKSC